MSAAREFLKVASTNTNTIAEESKKIESAVSPMQIVEELAYSSNKSEDSQADKKDELETSYVVFPITMEAQLTKKTTAEKPQAKPVTAKVSNVEQIAKPKAKRV